MKVIDPFLDGEGVWQGDSPGTMRKRFQCFGIKNSVDFCSNVTVYAPGEGSVFHNHPSSEELSYVISGSGVIQDMEQNVKAHIEKLISLTLAAAMSLSLAACGGGGTSAGSTPPPSGSSTGSGAVQSVADYDIQPELDSSVDYTQGDSYSFIIATDGAEDRVDGLLVHYMADQLNAITGGRIQLQMYFNGSMGTDTELCESTQAGDVAFFLGSTAFTANFVPELNAIDLPFLYQDAQQFRDTMDDETVFRFYEEKYQDKGFELIGFFDQGMRQMTSNIKVQSPDDMQGQKIRVMENQLHISIWQALGANPTPMAFSEVYMALQQGTIDAQETPLRSSTPTACMSSRTM